MKPFLVCLLTLSCGLYALGQDSLNVRRLGIAFTDQWTTAMAVTVQGNFAYVAADEWGLRILDVSDPSNPVQAGFYDAPEYAEGVAVSGIYAYVAYGAS